MSGCPCGVCVCVRGVCVCVCVCVCLCVCVCEIHSLATLDHNRTCNKCDTLCAYCHAFVELFNRILKNTYFISMQFCCNFGCLPPV